LRLIGNLNEMASGATIPAGMLTHPRTCAVIPNRTTDPEGFVETGTTCQCGIRTHISIGAVREMARMVGMVKAEEVETLVEETDARIESMRREIAELQTQVETTRELENARSLVAAADQKDSA
jgi:hypothetical protein